MEAESKTLEYKETNTKRFLKTVSAFANYGSGRIVFGVTDSGELVGIADPKTFCLDVENAINDNIVPHPDYKLAAADDGTVVLTVQEGQHKPYLYNNKAFKRNDTSTIEVDRLEMQRLILEGRNQSYEELPARNQDLKFTVLEEALQQELGIQRLTQDILKTLELYHPNGGYNRAAELLADKNDAIIVDIVRFRNNINEIQERKALQGVSLLDAYQQAVKMFQAYYLYEKIEGMKRSPVEEIPETAFREALANAMLHRMWDVTTPINIRMFADSIEVTSPGGLPRDLSEAEFLAGKISVLRNPLLAEVFYRLHIIEKFGTGIRRIRQAYADFAEQPSFDVYPNSIAVTLPVQGNVSLTVEERSLFTQMVTDRPYSRLELAEKTGIHEATVRRLLKKLSDHQLVKIQGKGRATRYIRI